MISPEHSVVLKETADLIRTLRTEKKLSQTQVAFEIGVGRTHYQAIERGAKNFSILILYRLAEVLEVDPKILIISQEMTAK